MFHRDHEPRLRDAGLAASGGSRTKPRLRAYIFTALTLSLAVVSSLVGGAKCYEPDTRVVVFVQGVYTSLDEEGTQTSWVEDHRFEHLKAAFVKQGYTQRDFLDFSYNGGEVTSRGEWRPEPYDCAETDQPTAESVAGLEKMLRDYREKHEGVHFTLVGHSLGGYIAFATAADDAARPEDERLDIDVVVTMDAPLLGTAADKKIILDLVDCEKTYEAGGDMVAAKGDPRTPSLRAQQAAAMAAAGIRLGTFGNENDCLYDPTVCAGGTWADDTATQFLPGQAAVSVPYVIESGALQSHDAILVHAPALADVVAFVGAP